MHGATVRYGSVRGATVESSDLRTIEGFVRDTIEGWQHRGYRVVGGSRSEASMYIQLAAPRGTPAGWPAIVSIEARLDRRLAHAMRVWEEERDQVDLSRAGMDEFLG